MITVVVLLGIGVVISRAASLPGDAAAVLDKVVLWLALPAVILDVVPRLQLGAEAFVPIGVAWGTLLLLAGLVLAASKAFRWDRKVTGTMLLVVPLGNTSFLGFPAVIALLGRDHLAYAVIYDQFGSFLALVTYGAFIAARYGHGNQPSLGETAGRVLVFPPFLALLVAIAARQTGLPGVVEDLAGTLGATLVPVAMLSVGLRLWPLPTSRLGTVVAGLVLRMGAAPAAVLAAAMIVGGSGLAWDTSILEAAMPPMVTAGVIAAEARLDAQLAAAMVGIGVIVGVLLVLPAWAGLIN